MTVQIYGVLYSLEAKEPQEISQIWQIFQIVFYICTIILSFSVIYCFSDVITVMHHNCILSAELFLVEGRHLNEMNMANVSCTIDMVNSKFFDKPCNIVLFAPVITITLACFFTLMFLMCGRGGAGKDIPDAWRIVVPTIITNLVSFCLIFYTAMVFQGGLDALLDRIKKAWGIVYIDLSGISCLKIENEIIGESLSKSLKRVKISIWLLVTFWGLGLSWILLRFLFAIDFQLVQVTNESNHAPFPRSSALNVIPYGKTDGVQDDKDRGSDVSNESFYTAQSEFSESSHQSVPLKAQLSKRKVHFNDDLEEVTDIVNFFP